MTAMTIIPIGGLCNRMRALNAALSMAERAGTRLDLVWCRDRSLNCRFDELFVPPASLAKIVEIDLHSRLGGLTRSVLIALRSRFGSHWYDQTRIEAALNAGADLSQEFLGKRVVVETCSAFCQVDSFHRFVPVPALARAVAALAQGLGDRVGVHLRRTDNEKSRCGSPTPLFVQSMRELLESGRCTGFFLATDAPDEEFLLREAFPGLIVSHPKVSCDRDDPAAIKDALIDLYCLSHCRLILGSYWSSFSETAAAIGGQELMVVREPSS